MDAMLLDSPPPHDVLSWVSARLGGAIRTAALRKQMCAIVQRPGAGDENCRDGEDAAHPRGLDGLSW